MDFSYETEDLRVGITGADAEGIVLIMGLILSSDQSQIDALAERVRDLTGRLFTSNTALQTAIQTEEN